MLWTPINWPLMEELALTTTYSGVRWQEDGTDDQGWGELNELELSPKIHYATRWDFLFGRP